MNAILASLTDPSAVDVAAFLGSLVFIVTGWNQIQKFIDRQKDKPAPGEVRSESADKYVPKVEFRDHVVRNQVEHDNIWKKLGGMERGLTASLHELERRLNAEDETRTKHLHDRLNDILAEVGEIRGRLETKK